MIKQVVRNTDKQVLAVIALIMVAIAWGATFVVVADAIALYPIYAFLALRFAVASLAFAAFFPRVFKRLDKENFKFGALAGILLSVGYILQTLALLPADQGGTSPARTAFFTGLYVIIVPIIQSIMKRKLAGKGTVIGTILAILGLLAMSGISFSGNSHWNMGDTLVLISAFAYSAHILLLGTCDSRHNTLALTFVQLVTVMLVTGAASLLMGENAGLPTAMSVWIAILICGIIASAFAFAVQTWSQRILPPSRVALILISEPALGGIFGWWAVSYAPPKEVLGAALLLAGMIVSETMNARSNGKTKKRLKRAVQGMPVVIEQDCGGSTNLDETNQ